MGIFDSLENSPALKGALGQLGAAVLPVVLSEIMGTGSQGGLNAIVAKLEQAGFGEQVKSWIGTAQNLPITADQLRKVLGSDTVRQIAEHPDRSGHRGAGPPASAGRGSREPRRQAPAFGLKGRQKGTGA